MLNLVKKIINRIKKQAASIINKRQARHKKYGFYIEEEILLDCLPASGDSPFYADRQAQQHVSQIVPHAEWLYFPNLKINYIPSGLIPSVQDKMLWQQKDIPKDSSAKGLGAFYGSFDQALKVQKKQAKIFYVTEIALPEDKLIDYFFEWKDRRLWTKHYEEPMVWPLADHDTVYLRNEHRISGYDINKQKIKWTYAQDSSEEFYYAFRHPHHNSAGWEMVISNGLIISELAQTLTALRISEEGAAKKCWSIPLGEYTLAATPIVWKEIIVVCLVNARMEIYLCGVSVCTGTMCWSTFIGISSFQSPVAIVSLSTEERLIVGLNHGIIVCLCPEQGQIIWTRKYKPKKYNVLEYYANRYFQGLPVNKKNIPYDTSFLRQVQAGLLCYKPRESDSVLFLDIKTGSCIQEISSDPAERIFLGELNGKFLFFGQDSKRLIAKGNRLLAFDCAKNSFHKVCDLAAGKLQGVVNDQANYLLVKVADKLYRIEKTAKGVQVVCSAIDRDSWLVGSKENKIFILQQNQLKIYSISEKAKNVFLRSNKEIDCFAAQIDQARKALDNARPSNSAALQSALSQVKTIEDLFETLVKTQKDVCEQAIQIIGRCFSAEIKNAIVNHKGIFVRLGNIFNGCECLVAGNTQKTRNAQQFFSKEMIAAQYSADAEDIRFVPVENDEESRNSFYLLSLFNQLLCVGENGVIFWHKKMFFPEKAIVFGDIIIVKDQLNCIAFSISDGAFRWSLSKPLYHNHRVNKAFFQGMRAGSLFVIIRANELFAIQPKTGICVYRYVFKIKCIESVYAHKEKVYMNTASEIFVFDASAITLEVAVSIKRHAGQRTIMCITPESFLLRSASQIDILCAVTGKITDSMVCPAARVTQDNNKLYFFEQLHSVKAFSYNKGSFNQEWLFSVDAQNDAQNQTALDRSKVLWGEHAFVPSTYEHFSQGKIYLLLHNEKGYSFAALDAHSGQSCWSVFLADIAGFVNGISQIHIYKQTIVFIVTSELSDRSEKSLEFSRQAYLVNVDAFRYVICLKTGMIITAQKLDSTHKFLRFVKPSIEQTKHCLISIIHGQKLESYK